MTARVRTIITALFVAAACTSDPATTGDSSSGTTSATSSGSAGDEGTDTTGGAGSTTTGTDGSSSGTSDGGSSAAATADSSGGESSSTGAAVGCTAMLCEDFEGGEDFDPDVWTLSVGFAPGISMTLQSDLVVSGTRAAHAHLIDTGGGHAQLRESVTFPALADEVWGRAYLYDTLSPEASHSGYVSAYVGDARVLEIGQYHGNWQLTRYGGNGEAPHGTGVAVPHDAWVCFEWRFTRAGDDLIEIYVDGVEIGSYASEGAELMPFTAVGIGLDNHGANPPGNDLYIDDIAIDGARIGCE